MPTQRNAHNDSAYSAWYITACIVVLSAIIGTAGYTYLQQQKQLVISEATLDLTTIVDLKVSQMVEWRKERIREATAIHSNTIISHHIKNHLKHKRTKNIKEISDWISGVQNSTGYKNILLFTPDGEVVTSALPLTKALSGDSGIIKDTVLKKEVLLSDLHIHEDAGEFDINLVIPILDPDSDSHECIAVLSIDINPLIHLYPLFRSWPTPSRTGENLLVRHDGNDVLFLNELRFRGKSAITFRQSLTKKDTPAARAALGEEGAAPKAPTPGSTMRSARSMTWGSRVFSTVAPSSSSTRVIESILQRP